MAKKIKVALIEVKGNLLYAVIDGNRQFIGKSVADKRTFNVGDVITVVKHTATRTIRATGPQCSVQFNRTVNCGVQYTALME